MTSSLTRFSVAPLHTMTRALAAVAMGRAAPDLVITGARVLSTYTERIHPDREVWIKGGRIAAVKPAGTFARGGSAGRTVVRDVRGGIIAPGLVDPHVHIESSMMTACAFAEAALRNQLADLLGHRGEQLVALLDRSHAKSKLHLIRGCGGPKRRAAIRAKRLRAFIATFSGFDIDLRFARDHF